MEKNEYIIYFNFTKLKIKFFNRKLLITNTGSTDLYFIFDFPVESILAKMLMIKSTYERQLEEIKRHDH